MKSSSVTRRLGRGLVWSVALLMVGCTSTRITNAWQDPQWKGTAFHRMFVMGVSTEPGVRRTYETAFTQTLHQAGVEAVPSYTVLPDDGQVPEDKIRAEVKRSGADAMLVTRLVRVERRTSISPGYYMGYPGFGYWGGFYGFYSAAWAVPPTINQYDVVTLETNVWDAQTNRIVWSGMTETSDPSSVNRTADELAHVLVKEMGERGVVPPLRK